jgi:beta-glucosidase
MVFQQLGLLQREVLKRDWNFDGFVVSDWGSEMMAHGFKDISMLLK